jgi:hypothetical protein
MGGIKSRLRRATLEEQVPLDWRILNTAVQARMEREQPLRELR